MRPLIHLIVLASICRLAAGVDWKIELLADAPGGETSLDVTPDGTPRIAYSVTTHLRYYTGVNSFSVGSIDAFSTIALAHDEDDRPLIAYQIGGSVVVASLASGSWQTVFSDDSGFDSQHPSLKTDAVGYGHLAYMLDEFSNGALLYANDLAGVWLPVEVDSIIEGQVNSPTHFLGLSPSGQPRIAFIDLRSSQGIQYAEGTVTGVWDFDSIVPHDVSHDYRDIALAVDTEDTPHVVYFDANENELIYATRDGSSWHFSVLEASVEFEPHPRIAIDSAGRPNVTYTSGNAGFVSEFLRRAVLTDGGWFVETVDSGIEPQNPSIAIDAYDGIHITYFSRLNDELRYATRKDCNGNGIHDDTDIAAGTLQDCNGNGQPDSCELALGFAEDCNGNRIPDDCDIAGGTSEDCNFNGVPDECDIDGGTSLDCNGNDVPDECEPDCNGNRIPDDCDIADGTSEDCDFNGVPDECGMQSCCAADVVGALDTPDLAYDVVVSGGIAYVADGASGLRILNVTDPTDPVLVGVVDTPHFAETLAVVGSIAYVADQGSGLQIVDVRDPASPVILGSAGGYDEGLDAARGVAVSGSLAYIGAASSGLLVCDVSDPANPAIIGQADIPVVQDAAQDVVLVGSVAYVADPLRGLAVFDVTTPTSPTFVDLIATPHFTRDVAISGAFLYVAADDTTNDVGLMVFDVSVPATPVLVASRDIVASAQSISIDGDYAYVAAYYAGLLIFDISEPANPMVLGGAATPGNAIGVGAEGGFAYLSARTEGLQIIDLSDCPPPDCNGNRIPDDEDIANGTSEDCNANGVPDECEEGCCVADIVGALDTPDLAYDVVVSGGFAYVADGASGLRILNVADPADPVLVGVADTPDFAETLVLVGSLAYVADQGSGLQVVDVGDPAAPVILGSAGGFGEGFDRARGVAVSGTLAYIGAASSGLLVCDVSDPSSPAIIGQAGIPSVQDAAQDVVLVGSVAYVADVNNGLAVFDVTTPTSPTLVDLIDTPRFTRDVAVSGEFLYVVIKDTTNDVGLMVFDISAPATPMLVASRDVVEGAESIWVQGENAYLAAQSTGLIIFDIAEPDDPTVLGGAATPGIALGVAVEGGHAYVSARTEGLHIIDISDCARATCPADLDGDGLVGFSDLLLVLSTWGPCPACPEDIDDDGDVGFSDLLTILSSWGPCP